MASTRLADIIDSIIFNDLEPLNDTRLNALIESGVIAQDDMFNDFANSPGRTIEMPYWLDLDQTVEPNYSDTSDNLAIPDKVAQDEQQTVKTHLNYGWSVHDLARELARAGDAMRHIRNRTDHFWNTQLQKRLVATSLGVFNNNVANDAADMVVDISIEDGNAATQANLFSRDSFVNANFTSGDRWDRYVAMAVHSQIMSTMVKNDDIDFIRDSRGQMTVPTYMGKLVLVDDDVPVIAGTTSGFRYLTMLWGMEAFAWGQGSPTEPVETDRNPRSGSGGGQEELWLRKTWLIHPIGHNNNNVVATGNANNQTLADLQDPTNWTRKVTRKHSSFAYLVTNG